MTRFQTRCDKSIIAGSPVGLSRTSISRSSAKTCWSVELLFSNLNSLSSSLALSPHQLYFLCRNFTLHAGGIAY